MILEIQCTKLIIQFKWSRKYTGTEPLTCADEGSNAHSQKQSGNLQPARSRQVNNTRNQNDSHTLEAQPTDGANKEADESVLLSLSFSRSTTILNSVNL